MIERLMAPGTFHQAPYCHAARAGNFLFVTGQVAADPDTGEYVFGDIEIETRRVMDNLTIVLETAGFGLQDVVSARAFLADFDEYETFNRVYTEYMGEFLPTRTTIGVVALAAGARVEVDLVAYRD
ncbi:MAG: 2-iminobutanoate/2-iminopropanoate deaminase [Solirubrobacteraceae bacterium]|jgi:2-iminobutanoate/2-iminopropanoate deaminase|nr:2-iminobutanoate/2-iminopropanoate deaminase [Solirubrobacteraceae bacterium]